LPGVTVTGSVPDVRPYMHAAALMVAPLSIARGTQNKILEALACGVPVLASRLAARGIDAVEGEHLLAEDDYDGYAASALRILEHRHQRARLSTTGRERVLSHHTWDRSLQRLDDVIDRCLKRSAQPLQTRVAAALI
jgi:glycosyltransferase involved in cell wall biosynthesis